MSCGGRVYGSNNMQLDFQAIFNEYIADSQKEWAHDRTLTVGASEVFGCLRKVWFRKRGKEFTCDVPTGQMELVEDGVEIIDGAEYPKFTETPIMAKVPTYPEDDDDEGSRGAAHRGDVLEQHYVVPAIREKLPEGKLLFGGLDQKTLFHNKNSATPDGIIVGLARDALALYGVPDIGTHCICLEIKTIDPRVRLTEEKAIHHGQAQTQMGIIHEKTSYRPLYTVILYVDASFLDKISPYIVKFDPDAWQAAQQRANTVYLEDNPAEIPPEGKLDGECALCDFRRSCAFVTNGSIPDDNSKLVDEGLLLQFDDLTAKHETARLAVAEAEADLEKIKAEIKDALILADTRKIGGKKAKRPWNVSWYSQAGRSALSRKLVQGALGEDLSAFETEGVPFDVLRITFSDEKTNKNA
jgi:hypothetical protein